MSKRDEFTQPAEAVPFDNTTNGFVAEDTQAAIEELKAAGTVSASPGFNFGRSGNVSNNSWLYVTGSVPSNRAGITIALSDSAVKQVYVANQNINTFDIQVYEHDGDEINLTLLGAVSIIASRTGTFDVDFPTTEGKQLAIRVTNGSGRNVTVGCQLKGNI